MKLAARKLRALLAVAGVAAPCVLFAASATGQSWAQPTGGSSPTGKPSSGGCANGSIEDMMNKINRLFERGSNNGAPNASTDEEDNDNPDGDESCKNDDDGDGGGGGGETGDGKTDGSGNGGGTPTSGRPGDGHYDNLMDDPDAANSLIKKLAGDLHKIVFGDNDGNNYDICFDTLGNSGYQTFGDKYDKMTNKNNPEYSKDPCVNLGRLRDLYNFIRDNGAFHGGPSFPASFSRDPGAPTGPPTFGDRAVSGNYYVPINLPRLKHFKHDVVDRGGACGSCVPGTVYADLNGAQVLISLGGTEKGTRGYLLFSTDSLVGTGLVDYYKASPGELISMTSPTDLCTAYPAPTPVDGTGPAWLKRPSLLRAYLAKDQPDSKIVVRAGLQVTSDKEYVEIDQVRADSVYCWTEQLATNDGFIVYVLQDDATGIAFNGTTGRYNMPSPSDPRVIKAVVFRYASEGISLIETLGNGDKVYRLKRKLSVLEFDNPPALNTSGQLLTADRTTEYKNSVRVIWNDQIRYAFCLLNDLAESTPAASWYFAAVNAAISEESWELTRKAGSTALSTERVSYADCASQSVEGGPVGAGIRTELREVLDGGSTIARERKWFRDFSAGRSTLVPGSPDEELIRVARGESTSPLVTEWLWSVTGNDATTRKLIGLKAPSGYWERYFYDADGWLTKKVCQYLNSADPGTSTPTDSQHRVIRYGRYTDLKLFAVGNPPTTPADRSEVITWESESILGQEVRREFEIDWQHGSVESTVSDRIQYAKEKTTIRCASIGSGPPTLPDGRTAPSGLKAFLEGTLEDPLNSLHAVSHERRFSEGSATDAWKRGRLDFTLAPDGTVTRYFHNTAPNLSNYGLASVPRALSTHIATGPAYSDPDQFPPILDTLPSQTARFKAMYPRAGTVSIKVRTDKEQTLLRETRALLGAYEGLPADSVPTTAPAWMTSDVVLTGTAVVARAEATDVTSDLFGRATTMSYLDGTTTSSTYSSCCGTDTFTNNVGLVSKSIKDAFGRVVQRVENFGTANQLTTEFVFDAADRVVKTRRIGSDSSSMVLSKQHFDAAGRVAWSKDAIGAKTVMTYELLSGGGTRTTTLQPSPDGLLETDVDYPSIPSAQTTPTDGPTVIEELYADGSMKSISGTATAPIRYEYGVATDTFLASPSIAQTTKTIRVGPTPTDESEWSKSYVDWLGRSYKEELPAANHASNTIFATSTYGAGGRLTKSVDFSGVTTLFRQGTGREDTGLPGSNSDWYGDWSLVAIDMPTLNGTIDFSGNDRISRTRTFFTTRTDGSATYTVRRTTRSAWMTDGSNSAILDLGHQDRSVDGLRSWQTVHGFTGRSLTSFDPGTATRTDTSWSPMDLTLSASLLQGVKTESVTTNGRAISRSTSFLDGSTTTLVSKSVMAYDPHGRVATVTDKRSDVSGSLADLVVTYAYDNADRALTTTLPPPATSSPSHPAQVTTATYDALGRVITSTVTTGSGGSLQTISTTQTTYWPTGAVKAVSGTGQYPVEYTYDSQGRTKTLTTFQDFTSTTNKKPAVTTWIYDARRGLLLEKRYADPANGQFPTSVAYPPSLNPTNRTVYAYDAAGRMTTRTWARGVSTTYVYATSTGQMTGQTYSDATPAVSMTYDRLGRITSVTDAAGVRTFSFDSKSRPDVEQFTSGLFIDMKAQQTYDSNNRRNGLKWFRPVSSSTPFHDAGFGYDAGGRMTDVWLGKQQARYSYEPATSRVQGIEFRALTADAPSGSPPSTGSGSTLVATGTKTYDDLGRLTKLEYAAGSVSSTTLPESYEYVYNARNQRTRQKVVMTPPGQTSGFTTYWHYTYDDLGQLTDAKRTTDDTGSTPLAGQWFGYSYDTIGNRKSATRRGTDTSGTAYQTQNYTTDYLNRYSQRSFDQTADMLGYSSATTVKLDFVGSPSNISLFNATRQPNSSTGPQYRGLFSWANPSVLGTARMFENNATSPTHSLDLMLPASPEAYTYDADGNMTSDGLFTYTWDAENRLIAVTGGAIDGTYHYVYDYLGRRVRKYRQAMLMENMMQSQGGQEGGMTDTPQQSNSEGGGELGTIFDDVRFIYDGWLLLAELNSGNQQTRAFVWGLDLSSTRGGAGGIGGLAFTAATSPSPSGWVASDPQGNVTAVRNPSSNARLATFEYGAFGESLTVTSSVVGSNSDWMHIRFSSKYWDTETKLSYYGYRFYNALIGKWVNRDPAGERSESNMYVAFGNNAASYVDAVGLWRQAGGWTWTSAQAVAECNDSLEELASMITGDSSDAIYLQAANAIADVEGGEVIDVRPLLDRLQQSLRDRVVANSKSFRAKFGNDVWTLQLLNRGAPEDIRALFFRENSVGSTDCSNAVRAIYYKSMLDVFGDEGFQRVFGSGRLNAFIIDVPAGSARLPGDHVEYRNASQYYEWARRWDEAHPNDQVGQAWGAEQMLIGEGNSVFGHDFGITDVATVDGRMRKLLEKIRPSGEQMPDIPGFSEKHKFFDVPRVGSAILEFRMNEKKRKQKR